MFVCPFTRSSLLLPPARPLSLPEAAVAASAAAGTVSDSASARAQDSEERLPDQTNVKKIIVSVLKRPSFLGKNREKSQQRLLAEAQLYNLPAESLISFGDIKLIKKLGEGSFSHIYRCTVSGAALLRRADGGGWAGRWAGTH